MDDPVRVIIWASPRTCSTALLKTLSGLPDAKIFDELYSIAFLFGPDRLDQSPTGEEPPTGKDNQDVNQLQTDKGYAFPSSICTYEWIKTTLERDYPGKRVIISKEIVYCLNDKYDSLPDGYKHVFLLRHPSKVFPSWKKLTHEVLNSFQASKVEVSTSLDDFAFDKQPPQIIPPGMSFKEAYDLYKYIKEKKLDEDPVIIDADDLVKDPADIMSALCTKLGIPYSDYLLTWDKGTDIVDSWTVGSSFKKIIQHAQCYENFRNSTGFLRQVSDKQAAGSAREMKVTPDIKHCIEFSMPFYLKMYEQRLKGNST